jgi:hypothetical protein
MTSTGFTDDVISLLSVGGDEQKQRMLELYADTGEPLDEAIKTTIIGTLHPFMENTPSFVKQIVARAMLEHVDWKHVAHWAAAGSN